nr:TetR/AcrR family transcriptional regulator [Kineosporia rhizophila]
MLAAATTVIAERGANGASVEAICEEAGFTRGAFYSNFSTKEDLLYALMQEKHQSLLEGIRKILDETEQTPAPEGADVIDDLVDKVLAANPVDRQSRLMETEIGLYMVRNPEQAPVLQKAMAPFHDELARLVVAGLGRAGRRLRVDTGDALTLLIAGYETGTTHMWFPAEPGSSAAAGEKAGLDACRRSLALILKAVSEPA